MTAYAQCDFAYHYGWPESTQRLFCHFVIITTSMNTNVNSQNLWTVQCMVEYCIQNHTGMLMYSMGIVYYFKLWLYKMCSLIFVLDITQQSCYSQNLVFIYSICVLLMLLHTKFVMFLMKTRHVYASTRRGSIVFEQLWLKIFSNKIIIYLTS